jgi:hypothetical protein
MSETILLHYSWIKNPVNQLTQAPVNFFQQYTTIKQQYSKIDAYFYYKRFKIFVSALPYDFFNYFFNVWSLGTGVITFRFVINNSLKNDQFYTSTSFQIPNIDVYYLPFNWWTTDLTYSDQAGLSRAADNSFYRIYSIGYNVVSYCKGFTNPDIYSNPFAPQVYSRSTLNALPIKTAPNGKPINSALPTDNKFSLALSTATPSYAYFRYIIAYVFGSTPLLPIDQIYISYNQFIPQYKQNYVFAGPTLPQSYYYLIDSLFTSNTGLQATTPTSTFPNLYFNSSAFGGTGVANIDCILVANKPIIGNNILVKQRTPQYIYQPVSYDQVVRANVNSDGSFTPNVNGLYWIFAVKTDIAIAQYTITYFSPDGPLPDGMGVFTYATQTFGGNTWNVGNTYLGITPFVQFTTTIGQYFLVWGKQPQSPNNLFYTQANTAITHGLTVYAEPGWGPFFPTALLRQNLSEQTIPYYGMPFDDEDWYQITDLHNFDQINFIPSTSPPQINIGNSGQTTAVTFNSAIYTSSIPLPQTVVDDAPLSMCMKILGAGFQARKYYNIKHIVKGMLLLKNLTWTSISATQYQSSLITLDGQLFSTVNEISGEIALSTDIVYLNSLGAGDEVADNMTLYTSNVTKNKYSDLIPIYQNNNQEYKYSFQRPTTFQSFYLVCDNFWTNPDPANTVILYFK